jgi:hypothetical protein
MNIVLTFSKIPLILDASDQIINDNYLENSLFTDRAYDLHIDNDSNNN